MTLNYREVAFVLNKSSVEIKAKFQELLKIDKVSIKDEIHVDTLSWQFGNLKSVDQRYDGLPLFPFYLRECKKSYRNFLNEKSCIKAKKFTGGRTVFYKTLTPEEIEFCNNNLAYKYREVYGKKA
jgi:hypothetical protein